MIKNKGVCNLEYAKELDELGCLQKSIWWWCIVDNRSQIEMNPMWIGLKDRNRKDIEGRDILKYKYSAPTCSELLESLPQYVNGKSAYALTCVKLAKGWWVGYMDEDGGQHPDLDAFNADTLINALCVLKIYLIKHNYIAVGKN